LATKATFVCAGSDQHTLPQGLTSDVTEKKYEDQKGVAHQASDDVNSSVFRIRFPHEIKESRRSKTNGPQSFIIMPFWLSSKDPTKFQPQKNYASVIV
jgi:hypothetical protein